jgi:hypothetical protein
MQCAASSLRTRARRWEAAPGAAVSTSAQKQRARSRALKRQRPALECAPPVHFKEELRLSVERVPSAHFVHLVENWISDVVPA